MKYQKLLISSLTGCLLVGASGAAIAAERCRNGLVIGPISTDVIVRNRPCVIRKASVSGKVDVKNAPNVTIFDSQVSGDIVVKESGIVAIMLSNAKNITANNNSTAVVELNVAKRNMTINYNDEAVVKENAAIGVITCEGNGTLDVFNNGSASAGGNNCQIETE